MAVPPRDPDERHCGRPRVSDDRARRVLRRGRRGFRSRWTSALHSARAYLPAFIERDYTGRPSRDSAPLICSAAFWSARASTALPGNLFGKYHCAALLATPMFWELQLKNCGLEYVHAKAKGNNFFAYTLSRFQEKILIFSFTSFIPFYTIF